MASVPELRTIEVPVTGMDCAECTLHVQAAIQSVPGVRSASVLLSAEKAVIELDPTRAELPRIRQAVQQAGYSIPDHTEVGRVDDVPATLGGNLTRQVMILLGVVFAAVLFIAIGGEWLGIFDRVTRLVPWPIGVVAVVVAGFPIFRNVFRASLNRQVTSHTLMTVGALAALAVGQWVTALVVVFFMRVGDYAERFTTERSRQALRDLTAIAPKTARIERNGEEVEVPLTEVVIGDTVVVRPGEQIPADGEVIRGWATIDQATITGESMPVEAQPGTHVYAATIAQQGSLRIKVTALGADTTFGRVIRLVEEAELHRADVQRFADRFATWYLPVVAGLAALVFLIRRDPLATTAVLVVACSCSFALATPIAMLASIGAGAKRGLLFKGGKYLETLARANVLLIDKTGTLTMGQPQITNIVSLTGLSEADILALAGSAERDSEHPLAAAVLAAVEQRHIPLAAPNEFVAIPGQGIRARVNGQMIEVGNHRMIPAVADLPIVRELEHQGKTTLFVARNGEPIGVLAAADTLRTEVPVALEAVRDLGVTHIELLTGDNERVAAALSEQLGLKYRANLLPEDKIKVVREYQQIGQTVIMVGDGVNDAPALAQADVGIAMGAAGTDIAIEAAHVALMREDWSLVPESLRIARRTMRVVKSNIGFTVAYNVVGLALAAVGILPPILAAAAQSLPDVGIMTNSARLLREKRS